MAVRANEKPDEAIHVETSDGPDDENEARLKQIRQRFQIHQTFWSEIHSEGLEDDKFVAGEQWPEEVRKDREEDRRPVLTYNLLPSFTRQISNKVRQERPQIKVVPVESNKGTSPKLENLQGTKDYAHADIYSGVIKNIEHTSRADQCYDTALKHAVDHGFGYFYMMNEWSRRDPFVQELVVHRVKNSYGIYLDPDAQEADFRDGQDAFMFANIKKKTFEAKYPDADFTEFAQSGMGSSYEGWYDVDHVRLAQYFWIEYLDDEVLQLSNGKIVYNSKVEDVLDEIEEQHGIFIAKDDDGDEMRKAVKRPVCMWQKMTARDILEGPLELPFSAIPIFPVLGDELMVDGRIRYESAIRHAKDAQKSYNYWRTAAAETVALAPRAPWVGTAKQFEGHEEMYEEANTRNQPYLLYNHVEGVAAPQRQFPSQVAAAELQNAIQDGTDMQTIIGLHDASLGRESNEKSGKAILARQSAGMTSTFQFPDNLNRALEQMGRLMVEAIPQIYDTQRIIRIRLPDNTDDFVEINQRVKDKDSDKTILVADIAYGKYDVVMETGPSYATLRQEAAELQMELLTALGPDVARNIAHLVVKNLGVPGSDEVATVLRRMLPDALKSEEEKLADLPKGVTFDEESGQPVNEDGSPYQPPPTLEQQLQQKQQQIDEAKHAAELATAEAKKATADADIKQAEAKIADAEAKMAELQDELGQLRQQVQEGADSGDQMTEIEQLIKRTMEDHEVDQDAHKAATAEQVAEAVVDALGRVKAYVDRQGQIRTDSPTDVQAPAAPSNGAGGAGVNIVLTGPRRIKFVYDNGNLVAAEAENDAGEE